MHFSHLFNFIKVNHETPLIGMVFLDTFSAKHREMVGTVKVLHPLIVFVAEQTVYALLVLEVDIS